LPSDRARVDEDMVRRSSTWPVLRLREGRDPQGDRYESNYKSTTDGCGSPRAGARDLIASD
jgi:hypothetical protein